MKIQKASPALKTTLSASTIFGILLALIWMRYTVVSYVLQVISMLPFVGVISSLVYPAMVILLTIIILPWMLKRVKVETIIFYMVAVIIILLSAILFPENSDVIAEKMPRMLTAVLPMVFIGVCYDHEKHKDFLFWASLVGVITMFAYQIYQLAQGEELMEDSMDAAYKTLPSIMFLIYSAFDKKKLRYCVIAVLAGMTTFVFGTRGPILCVFAFLAISLLQIIQNRTSRGTKVFLFVIVGSLACWLIFSDMLTILAESLSKQFAKWGFSTRIFDWFIEGDIANDNGRSAIFEWITAAIEEKPIIGHGLLGDQILLGQGRAGVYAHNLILELWMQFGVIGGTAILLYFLWRPAVALYKQKNNKDLQHFIWMLVCMNFVKLMLSSTYTVEQMFYFMIGVCIAAVHRTRSRAFEPEHLKE